MSIFIPRWERFRDKKPTGPLEVNWAHPSTDGLIICQSLDEVDLNKVPNKAGVDGPSVTSDISRTADGVVLDNSYDGAELITATPTPPDETGQFSFLVRSYSTTIPSGNNWAYLLSSRDSGDWRLNIGLSGDEDASNNLVFSMRNTNIFNKTREAKLPAPPINTWFTCGGTYDDDGDRIARVWSSEQLVHGEADAMSGTLESYTQEGLYLGNRRGGDRKWTGGISDFWFFNRNLLNKMAKIGIFSIFNFF